MSIINAVEARLAADAVQVVKDKERTRTRIDELIKNSAGKGWYRTQVEDIPPWLAEELKDSGYRVSIVSDGFEISWCNLDEESNYIRG